MDNSLIIGKKVSLDVFRCRICGTERGYGYSYLDRRSAVLDLNRPNNPAPLLNCAACKTVTVHEWTGLIETNPWVDHFGRLWMALG